MGHGGADRTPSLAGGCGRAPTEPAAARGSVSLSHPPFERTTPGHIRRLPVHRAYLCPSSASRRRGSADGDTAVLGLGPLEAAIMTVMWRADGWLTVREIRDGID